MSIDTKALILRIALQVLDALDEADEAIVVARYDAERLLAAAKHLQFRTLDDF